MQKITFLCLATLAILATSCKEKQEEAYHAIDPGMLDSSYRAGDDFYHFVNAKWIANNPIPGDKSRYASFDILDDNSLVMLRKVMEDASQANADKGSNTQKVGDFWASGMDTADIEAQGIKPIQPYLDAIQGIANTDDMVKVVAGMHRLFMGSMFNSFVQQDPMQSEQQIMIAWQGGLSLPDRDYYLLQDDKSKEIRSNYQMHIANVFKLIGTDETKAKANADVILKIETQLATSSMRRQDMRDPYAIYHKMSVQDLSKMVPAFNWTMYYKELMAPSFDSLNVAQPAFYTTLNSMLTSVSMDDWKTYLTFHFVDGASEYLSSAFVQENFDFYKHKLNGVKEMKPRWKSIVENADFALGEALGQEYVKVAFTPESKARMTEMINNLKASMTERINGLEWMGDSTKQKAVEKLNKMNFKIGYPDKWRDYSALEIDRGPYVLNMMRAIQFESKRQMDKIGKPVDKTEWGMTPQTVNAYYDPSNNEIVFPAAILQPPFFDPKADDAVNYGGIGAVIGHEITHGFDDEGRQFDAEGNLKQWWTDDDDSKFRGRADVIVQQYNGYCPLEGLCINGNLTLGENIADFGGLTVAYYAFMKTAEAKSGESMDGFTPEQRFFLGFARIWAGAYNDDAMRNQLLTNPHSPGEYRVQGVLMNMPEWYTAFNIQEGDKMFRPVADRAKIW